MIAGFSWLILKGFNTNNPAQCGENRTNRFKNPARVQLKDNLIKYVKNQKEHHKKVNFRYEYIALLKEHRVEFDEKFLL